MTSADRDESRLTAIDRDRITERVAETVAGWRAATGYTADRTDRLVLARVGAGAVGCSGDDLRDSELAQINAIVAEVVGQ